ncbi:MAG: hydroxymethylbilane synthase [Oligoflexia bacterium]|nr:hydroxymethylbilane synthase [Oligoflexia bacterium]
MKKYKIGTRGSLLALTQCQQIKELLEERTNHQFELVVIKTEGDIKTDKPLWQMEGKDFFTKELDQALQAGEIDLVVHSYKDLGSDRPKDFQLAAITERTFGNDILFIRKEALESLKAKTFNEDFVVGTSSPRRIVNIEANLAPYLPNGEKLKVTTKMLRGNVNTRLEKLNNKDYHAIVLALPGIERLAKDDKASEELKPLIADLDYMILPQSIFPSAASQGALGIECLRTRDDNGELLQALQTVHHNQTQEEVRIERQLFQTYGGGCHLAVGINVTKFKDHFLVSQKGTVDNLDIEYQTLEGGNKPIKAKFAKAFVGLGEKALKGMPLKYENYLGDTLTLKKPLSTKYDSQGPLLVTTTHAMESFNSNEKNFSSLWTAGAKTMRKLAAAGQWVNGTSDSLGSTVIDLYLESKLVQLFEKLRGGKKELTILSHKDSKSKSSVYPSETIHTYDFEITESQEDIENCPIFYWTSYRQYQAYVSKFPAISSAIHCCGIGKTYELFKESNIEVFPFYSVKTFDQWLIR